MIRQHLRARLKMGTQRGGSRIIRNYLLNEFFSTAVTK